MQVGETGTGMRLGDTERAGIREAIGITGETGDITVGATPDLQPGL
ncbi:hypothetical protein B0G93_10260 [Bacillus sp. V-88]|nr:hypothetical protein B0G93_10260 [Bacillus sp. V-88]SLK10196.1 hypothetical protein SAMN06295884_10260 [Bacillus sp. V-88]